MIRYIFPLVATTRPVAARVSCIAQIGTTESLKDESKTPGRESGSLDGAVPQDVADLMPYIACPLTKAPLRYDVQLGKLVSDELGVAFSVLHGVPQLVPLLGEVLPPSEGDDHGDRQHEITIQRQT
ncbi:hypothetical protein Vretimale_5576 [Volvox reticuliferus]|uniref:Protein preY, mitochondrial n=2 Tax=Volvox reticuliferus TaxID=1737510 RepID=A0A8J4LK52_9CHLO|nr:hypothetical protein Vretimale_5576 [Volvox reticuliferus]